MIELRFRSNFGELQTWLGQLATKQVPFATAKALTRTAQDAQAIVRAELPRHFVIRSPWVSKGIRIVPASKNDWPHARAIVGSVDDFMKLQETGGTKRPSRGAKNLAIPTTASTRRRNASGRLPTSAKPRAILNTKAGFVADQAVKKRLPKKRTGTPVLTLFLLRKSSHIKPRFHLHETVDGTVAKVWGARFLEAFEAAVAAPKRARRLR